jgi:hypothetical protein
MKILVTKQQLRFIHEQMDSRMPFQPETMGFVPGKPETVRTATDNLKKTEKDSNPDDIVNIISAVLEGVPGVGNLASFVIDEIHAITYLIRAIFTTGYERTENLILAVLTAALAFVPMVGNIALLASRQGIKTILKQTPDSIQKWAIKNGIINYRVLFGKGMFKYSKTLLLVRMFKDDSVDAIAKSIDKIEESFVKAKSAINQKGLGLLYPGLTPILLMGLNKAFDAVISNLNEISLEEIKVAKQMIDKGFI